jgi:hypothetical protein
MLRLNAITTLSRLIALCLGLPISVPRIRLELAGITLCSIQRSMIYTSGASGRHCDDSLGAAESCLQSERISCQSEKYAKKNGCRVDLLAAYGAGEMMSPGTRVCEPTAMYSSTLTPKLISKILLPFLDEEHRRQIEEGVIGADEIDAEETAYPYSGA